MDAAGDLYVTDCRQQSGGEIGGGLEPPRPCCRSPGSTVPPVWRWTPPATSTSPTNYNGRVLKLAAGSTTPTVLPFTGLNAPTGVAVDAAGDLYVADWGNNRVLKLAAGSTTQTVLPFTGLNGPDGVAVDTAGNLYVADTNNNRVVKLPAATAPPASPAPAPPPAAAPASPAPTSEPPAVTVTATAAAPAGPPMAHGAVLGAQCDPSGPFAGYAADGSVLVCPPFGQWTPTAHWYGVHEIGSKCPGQGGAVSPGGVGLLCVGMSPDGSGTWQPGP